MLGSLYSLTFVYFKAPNAVAPCEIILWKLESAFECAKFSLKCWFLQRTLRVFGHVDFSVFLELIKNIQTVTLRPREYLFRIGEPDEVRLTTEAYLSFNDN